MDLSSLATLATPGNLGIGSAIAGVIAIIVWFLNRNSPEQKSARYRVEKAELELRKGELEGHQPTKESAEELLKIEKRLAFIKRYLENQ